MSNIIQTYIIASAAIITIPIYIWVLIILIKGRKRERFNSHFYSISISHGFIDIVGFLVTFLSFNIRGISIFKPFFWSLNDTIIVQFTYTQTYYFMYARFIGVVLISIQRCLTVSYHTSSINFVFQNAPTWSFFLIQWLLPIPLCIDIMFADMTYDNPNSLNHVISYNFLFGHYIRATVIPVICTIICIFCYGSIIYTFRQNNFHKHSKNGTRELKLSIQVVGLLVGLLLIATHFMMQLIFLIVDNTSAIMTMRSFLPVYNGFLTFINPWMMVIINTDIRKSIIRKSLDRDSTVVNMRQQSTIPSLSK